MERILGLDRLPETFQWPAIITLGVFDGVHRGHQRIIADTADWAREKGGQSVIITFDRQPAAFLGHEEPSFITSLEHRLMLFEELGVDYTAVLTFDDTLAAVEPENFIKNILVERFAPKGVVWGFDCRFGKGGRGDISMLREFSTECGFQIRTTEPVVMDGTIISSTAIRQAILNGELANAEKMLGRPVSVLGTVVHGEGRGKDLGFPTANLNLHHEIKPPPGVYACRAILEGKTYPAVTNIGQRPTFHPELPTHEISTEEDVIEVHVMNLDQPMYGKDMLVHFATKLREELRFDTPDELCTQMEKDRQDALQIFQSSADTA